jgi:sulfite reductase (NADPH) flavoprotein alpha-component
MNAPTSMPIIPLIPENAPFNAEQRAWLSGFLAGALALDNAGVTALSPGDAPGLPAGGDEDEAPWHDPAMPIDERMTLAEGRPFARRMMAAMAQQDCGQCGSDCATYSKAIAEQAEERLNLCAPGGKETARMLKKLIEESGGGATSPEDRAAKPAPVEKNAAFGYSRATPVEASFVARYKLNGEGSEKITNHIEIDLGASGLAYEVGDSLGVFAQNELALVDAVLAAIDAPADFPIGGRLLRDVLIEDISLGVAPDMLFQLISLLTGGARRLCAQALSRGEDPDGDAASLDVLGALEKFAPLRPDPEAFVESLEPLQPRLYSISSSPRAHAGRVTLTIDTVRYRIGERDRHGVASTWFADRLPEGSPLKVYVQKAHGFGLPSSHETPIIMVGPGTGVAPFRAFLQERLAQKAGGGAWLFFGHQREASDFFYREELEGFTSAGALTRLSTAWSRDGAQKVYVQDRMREAGAELWAWLDRGAHFYICGDAKRMARDVEQTLCDIAAQHGGLASDAAKAFIAGLKKSGRYQADVY